ncbi:hypothetical protein [Synechococcus sp. KORDI-52]|uniref:hypothetical protein n=1 Tax=Synechococcus sp. KORDI-52 TaxID=585425 RepID=UPI0012EB9254|nr:hypothetical protein [Synechococcus sp. KORDI-52]
MGIDETNTNQTKTPKTIIRKQVESLVTRHGPIRPKKQRATIERRNPNPKTTNAGIRNINPSIYEANKDVNGLPRIKASH